MLIWSLLWSFVPTVAGWSPTVVATGSMEPSLSVGDVVHIDPTVNLEALGVGSVIAFDDPGIPGMRVTHRVTGVEWDGDDVVGYRTKGDANDVADSTIVPVANVEGAGRLVVPYAGIPRVWAMEGRWIHLAVFGAVTLLAAMLAGDTVRRYLGGGARRRPSKQLVAIAVAIAVMLGGSSTTAAFTATTGNTANSFSMTSQWFLDTIDRDNPIAHWRLGETPSTPITLLSDDLEVFTGWTQYGQGDVVSSTKEAHSGIRSAESKRKDGPGGAWKSLSAPVGSDVGLDVWVWRKNKGKHAVDRIGLVNAGFDGYSIRVDHHVDQLQIMRRTADVETGLGTPVSFDPPENQWYRLQLVREGNLLVLSAFDGAGATLVTTTASDPSTNSFDRVVVYNADNMFVDDLVVVQDPPPAFAVDRVGTLPGLYRGSPTVGVTGLVAAQPDTAVHLDGLDDGVLLGDHAAVNLTTRATRTLELWFRADVTAGRQVLYEEGGTTDGMNVYLDGTTLRATAWSATAGWSNGLVTTSAAIVAGTTYHVAVTLDAVGTRSLVLYLDGAPVSTATKTDANPWNAHADDGAIGMLNGGTRFHDGNASGTGSFPFDGTVDEVVLFNSVVPAANIANHHAAGA